MTASSEYDPPASSSIKERQNDTEALRLLIAQRRLYRRAKRWLGVRWIGMVIIGIGAPVVSVLWPSLAVGASAVAGTWLFLGRTALIYRQTAITSRAAAVQEQFDLLVFGMPDLGKRSDLPKLEEIVAIAGPDDQLRKVAQEEDLIEWYPIESDDGATAVGIAQRANASYSDSLLKTAATVWSAVIAVWITVLIIVSVVAELTLAEFLMGVAFPVLPAFLDIVQYVSGVRRSAAEKHGLASVIEDHLGGRRDPVKPGDLLVWQAQLFDLRRSAPEVPDFIYKLKRKSNERSMKSAARQLSDQAKRHQP